MGPLGDVSRNDRESPVHGRRFRRIGRGVDGTIFGYDRGTAFFRRTITSAGTRDRWIGKKTQESGGRVLSPGGFRCPPDPLVRYPVSGDDSVDRSHRESPLLLLKSAHGDRTRPGGDRSSFSGSLGRTSLLASRRLPGGYGRGVTRLFPPCCVHWRFRDPPRDDVLPGMESCAGPGDSQPENDHRVVLLAFGEEFLAADDARIAARGCGALTRWTGVGEARSCCRCFFWSS